MTSGLFAGFEQAAEPITWVLVHFVWQAAVVAAGLWVVLRLLSDSDPWTRYRCACWALLLVVVLPLVTLLRVIEETSTAMPQATVERAVRVSPEAQTSAPQVGRQMAPSRSDIDKVLGIARWTLFAVWLIGASALSWIHMVGWWRVRMLKMRGVMPAPPGWQGRAEAIARQLGFKRAIRVLQSVLVEVPTVIGCFRPVILLPLSTLTGLEPRQIEAILAHELAHVWRRDALVNMLQVIAETILFYHPAVWWISERIRHEREHCCDDAAVAVTGDRLTLARALLQLEELRRPAPRLATTAAGGSLRHRITRLLGGETMSRHHVSYPLLGAALVASTLAVAGVAWAAAAINVAPVGATQAGSVGAATAPPSSPEASSRNVGGIAGKITGSWEPMSRGSRTTLQLRVDERRGNSTIGLSLSEAEAAALSSAIGAIELRREAGSFQFSGTLGGGGGDFSFSPDAGFFSDLESYGVTGLDSLEKFVIAATGIDRRWVEELDALGHGDDLNGDTLIALGVHRVTPEYVRELASAGVENANLDGVLAMRIHGLSAEWIEQMTSLGFELEADELLAWKIHGVSSEYVESLSAAGFDDLEADEILAMRIHGASPEWLEGLRAAGLLEEIDAGKALAMKIHGVTPAFLDELNRHGYHSIEADDLVAMRIHGVSDDFIEELEGLGYSQVDVDDLVAMRIHGVSAEYIEKQQQEHGSDLSIDDLIEHKVVGHSHRH